MGYSIYSYSGFVADEIRTNAYVKALSEVITADSVVLDIGTGTGFFAVLSCKLGARKVYAVEYNDAIQLGHELARANNCAQRIEFIQGMSTKLSLPEQANVIVSDLHGQLPWYTEGISTIIDARERLLAPGGVLIPHKDMVWASLVNAPAGYDKHVERLCRDRHGISLAPVRRYLVNSWLSCTETPNALLCEPALVCALDYTAVKEPNLNATLEFVVTQSGTAHGFSVWFEGHLRETKDFSTSPSEPELVYGRPFFPFERPVELKAGDKVELKLRADLDFGEYIWRWTTSIRESGASESSKLFDQSTFFSDIITPQSLHKRSTGYQPNCSEDGMVDAFVLDLMNGELSLQEIANRLQVQFPERFAQNYQALSRVCELSLKYG